MLLSSGYLASSKNGRCNMELLSAPRKLVFGPHIAIYILRREQAKEVRKRLG